MPQDKLGGICLAAHPMWPFSLLNKRIVNEVIDWAQDPEEEEKLDRMNHILANTAVAYDRLTDDQKARPDSKERLYLDAGQDDDGTSRSQHEIVADQRSTNQKPHTW